MPKYLLNIDRKVTCWTNHSATVHFDGSLEELKELIEQHDGNLDMLTQEGVIEGNQVTDIYTHTHNFLAETEQPLTPAENNGKGVFEINDIALE